MSKAKLNLNVLLKILLLLGFSILFIFKIANGTANKYVNPRIFIFMVFSSVLMLICAGILCFKLFENSNEKFKKSLFIYFFPLLLAFVFPAVSFNAASASDYGNSAYVSQKTNTILKKENKQEETIKENSGKLVLDEKNFYTEMYSIYSNPELYLGKEIEVVGFVFKDDNFSKNQFVPARLVMVCCAADMVTSGLVCNYDKAYELEENSWVKVSGVIEETEINGETLPCIMAKSVESVSKPQQEYIYPY